MSTDRWMDKEIVVHVPNYSAIKRSAYELVLIRCMSLEPIIQSREKKLYIINTYIWNLERWYWWTYFQGSIGDTDRENTLVDTVRGRRGWDEWREQHGNIYTNICKIDSQWKFAIWLRGLNWRCSLTTWEVGCVGGGTEVQEGEDLHVYLWLIHETNTLL